MRARLGINTCFAVKRWPEPGDWARIVRDELGLDTVELSLDLIEDVGGRTVNQVRSALDEYGLRAETVFTGLAAYSLNLLMHPDAVRRLRELHGRIALAVSERRVHLDDGAMDVALA